MTDLDLVTRTRTYVDASNDHDLGRITTMFAEQATYHSSGVGEHTGVGAILAMTSAFFAANPDVNWQPTNFRLVEKGGVEFDFIITIAGKASQGVERVFFDTDGRILRVEVER